jgi:hypothetical protein
MGFTCIRRRKLTFVFHKNHPQNHISSLSQYSLRIPVQNWRPYIFDYIPGWIHKLRHQRYACKRPIIRQWKTWIFAGCKKVQNFKFFSPAFDLDNADRDKFHPQHTCNSALNKLRSTCHNFHPSASRICNLAQKSASKFLIFDYRKIMNMKIIGVSIKASNILTKDLIQNPMILGYSEICNDILLAI